MRLLKCDSPDELVLTKDEPTPPAAYAILSHTWGADDDEVTFDDIEKKTGKDKAGYAKLWFCANQAKKDGLDYCWVDTCCINKANLVELDEAIRSMFRWYRGAVHCYVYLSDVPLRDKNNEKNRAWKLAFHQSRWFRRGWTLQELLAPDSVKFFSQEGDSLGTKASLEQQIHEITQIPVAALRGAPLSQFSPEDRLQWASKRETKKEEDRAYCLLGIFSVFMSLMYGEGDNAFKRLKDEINRKTNLSQLKVVEGALYNSYGEVDEYCHPDTRRDLLEEIRSWTRRTDTPNIFWLNGMAGTGKSTICRTVAKDLAASPDGSMGTLGASFFFKRGEGDRGSASLLFPTLAGQLATRVHGFSGPLAQALTRDPQICSKALGEQFKRLVDEPLQQLPNERTTYVVVIDALDECGKEHDIRTVLDLWLTWSSTRNVHLKLFLTSRPELPIRLGFQNKTGHHQALILHEVPQPIVQHDISIYLSDAFSKIRDEYNCEPPGESLDGNWPGDENIAKLAAMAAPLFIIAATIYRFIQQGERPREQLDTILCSGKGDQKTALLQLYTPVLHAMTVNLGDDDQEEKVFTTFRYIIGSIVNLAEPLSPRALASLLGITLEDVNLCLRRLHAVLQVPQHPDALVRPLHLSFGEFLMSTTAQTKPFGVDMEATHSILWRKCLQLLNGADGLQENLCGLEYPGQKRAELSGDGVAARLPLALRYACRYWVYHLEMSPFTLSDNDEVHEFLLKHFLHWLEALSLLDQLADAIKLIVILQSKVVFLDDARRFILTNRFIGELAPLQLYSSATIFAPQNSIVRKACGQTPRWITQSPNTKVDWGHELQKLEGHTNGVNAVAFSPDGSLLASASLDKTVRVWTVSTGVEIQQLDGHTNGVNTVVFSPNGSLLASASMDRTVRVWNIGTGTEVEHLKGHTSGINAIAFSPDGALLASASLDKTVRVWNVSTGEEVKQLKGHTSDVNAVAFSPDGALLASTSGDRTVRVWNVSTGVEVEQLNGHTSDVNAVAFSPDGALLASASGDGTVRVWNASTRIQVQQLEDQIDGFTAVVFSPNGSLLASASWDRTVHVWNVGTGVEVQQLKGHTRDVNAVAFSPDGSLLASASVDGTVRVWNAGMGMEGQQLEGHTDEINAVAFSPNGSLLASASWDTVVCVWNACTGMEVQQLKGHTNGVNAVAFSPDGSLLVSASVDGTVRVWNTSMGIEVEQLKGHTSDVNAIAFSPNGSLLASASMDRTVCLWNIGTGTEVEHLKGHTSGINAIAFSPDGALLASASGDRTVRVWNVGIGVEVQQLKGHTRDVNAVAFSPDGSLLASASWDETVRVWSVSTGSNTRKIGLANVSHLNFTADSKSLITNRGRISLDAAHDVNVQSPTQHMINLVLNNDWIECCDKRVLWLPQEYRSVRTAFIDNLVAIGTALGGVVFIRFDVSYLNSKRDLGDKHLVVSGD